MTKFTKEFPFKIKKHILIHYDEITKAPI